MDVSGAFDESAGSGRRSRVVLTPRRWRQVCGDDPQATVTKEPDHRGEHEISRKTIARGMPDVSGVTVVTNARAYYQYTRGCGRTRRPAFPAPSVRRDKVYAHDSGAARREKESACVPTSSSLRKHGPIRRGPSLKNAVGRLSHNTTSCGYGSLRPVRNCALGRDDTEYDVRPMPQPSLRATGSRECAPDDRLREAIHRAT